MDKKGLSNIPKMDDVLDRMTEFKGRLPAPLILEAAREAVDEVRSEVLAGGVNSGREVLLDKAAARAVRKLEELLDNRLCRVVNATGIIIHTNLGRAPMPKRALEGLDDVMCGYSSLEYSVTGGTRRSRLFFLEKILCALTGAEAAICVNNNAAAVFLVLNSVCSGKEALLSRGEIVEIGDSFRISEIIAGSGAFIREVGATNRTRLEDYERSISDRTGVILKVHTSNFRITGYSESVSAAELSVLGRKYELPVIEDMGSGVLTDLTEFGLPYERQVRDALRSGADAVTFSGDKLLGGPQVGIIAGKKEIIDKVRTNQLTRCMRIDKARLYMLENMITAYYENGNIDIPVYKMLASDVRAKAEKLFSMLNKPGSRYNFEIVKCSAQVGGGAMPGEDIDSLGVAVWSEHCSANEIEAMLRRNTLPVIASIRQDKAVLNVMTIEQDDFTVITEIFHGQEG